MFSTTDGTIVYEWHGRTVVLDQIDPWRAARALTALGYRPAAAEAIASGALQTGSGVRALARRVGLLAPVDVSEARAAGLIK